MQKLSGIVFFVILLSFQLNYASDGSDERTRKFHDGQSRLYVISRTAAIIASSGVVVVGIMACQLPEHPNLYEALMFAALTTGVVCSGYVAGRTSERYEAAARVFEKESRKVSDESSLLRVSLFPGKAYRAINNNEV
ncbi:MAG: hypothetical protein Q8Q60_02685 [Candidatus Chromulinivorax sp.]|nr:hypothetical protein [Candidatus Chromulinivorax sp.]